MTVMPPVDPGLPAIYLHLVAELLRERGIDADALLAGAGIDASRLSQEDRRVPLVIAGEVVRRAILAAREPGLGIVLAQQMRIPMHGTLGAAVLSSGSLREALDLTERFMALRAPLVRLNTVIGAEHVLIRFTPLVGLGPLHAFIMDAVILSCAMIAAQLLGTSRLPAEMLRQGREPAYIQRFRPSLPLACRYEESEDAIRLPAALLDTRVRPASEQSALATREQCEQALRQLGQQSSYAERVRRVVETSHPFPPRLTQVARTLFVSDRTLKRRLQTEDQHFQSIVDQARQTRAEEMLRTTRLSLAQIGEALGYADAANFTRAFRRWTGVNPSLFRSRLEKH